MKKLFDQLEKARVKEKYKIDLDDYVKKLIFLEHINEDNVYEMYQKHFEEVKKYLPTLKEIESSSNRSKFQPYSSLIYYFREWKRACENLQSSRSANKTRAVAVTNNFVYSAYNYICFLVFEAVANNESKTIIAFEACPSDQNEISSRAEIREIKGIAKKAGVNSLLVFATNINTFKYVCLSYEFEYLHFACHGNVNGDLLFVGNYGFTSFLSFKAFENFFANEFHTLHPKSVVESCYLNSCFSKDFAYNIHSSGNISSLFKHKLGYIGPNDDTFAIESAKSIYNKHFLNHKTIKNSFDDTKKMFASSPQIKKNEYSSNMIIYC